MKDTKEFHGKTLDEAIRAACQFYGVEREKLEIEIVNDSKMGIFGLVNVKKACVRASLVNTDSFLESLTETLTQPEAASAKGKKGQANRGEKQKTSKPAPKSAGKATKDAPKEAKNTSADSKGQEAQTAEGKASGAKSGRDAKAAKETKTTAGRENNASAAKGLAGQRIRQDDEQATGQITGQVTGQASNPLDTQADSPSDGQAGNSAAKEKTAGRSQKRERNTSKTDNRPRRGRGTERRSYDGDTAGDADDNGSGEGFNLADLSALNQEELHTMIYQVVNRLVSSIIGEVPLTITVEDGHIRVKVDCEEDARILVGREGQTLASVQYIASRILAGKLQGAVRLHIDTGNYKENQDARLTSLALMLAEKLRKSGRTQSTRPLSAYQRRIVHLALEEEEDIQTSSKGDGPQRRVLIHFKRNRNQRGNGQACANQGGADDVCPEDACANDACVDDVCAETRNERQACCHETEVEPVGEGQECSCESPQDEASGDKGAEVNEAPETQTGFESDTTAPLADKKE